MGRPGFTASRSSGRERQLLFIYLESSVNPRLGSGLPSSTLQIFGLNRTGHQSFTKCTKTSLCQYGIFIFAYRTRKDRHGYTDWPSGLGCWF